MRKYKNVFETRFIGLFSDCKMAVATVTRLLRQKDNTMYLYVHSVWFLIKILPISLKLRIQSEIECF